MKALKIILLIVVVIAVAVVVIGATGPKEMHVKESVEIDAPSSMVYEVVSDLKTWDSWGYWQLQDSLMEHTYTGADAGLGAKNTWISKSQGNGSQEIVEAKANEHLKLEMHFDGWDAASYAEWFFEEKDGKTMATWTMDQEDINFMARVFMSIFNMEEVVSSAYQTSLTNLKNKIEAMPKFEPETAQISDMWYIGQRFDGVTEDNLKDGAMHGAAYQAIGAAMAQAGTSPGGMPICIIHSYNEGVMDLEFGLPVVDSVGVSEGMIMGKVPAGQVMQKMHYGSYESAAATWTEMDAYMTRNSIESRFPPYEVYTNDPTTVADESQIETLIVYPVN